MKILQSGAPKCGNFWLYQIIQKTLQRADQPSFSRIEQHPINELGADKEVEITIVPKQTTDRKEFKAADFFNGMH